MKREEDLTDIQIVVAHKYLSILASHYAELEGFKEENVLTKSSLFTLQEGIWSKSHLTLTAASMSPYIW